MATTKKSASKRLSASVTKSSKKSAPRKKPAAARATSTKNASTRKPVERSTGKSKSTTRASKASSPAAMKSFRVAKTQEPFLSLKVTVQTLYWLILASAVLLLGLWVLNIHNKVQSIYDEIDQSNIIQQELDAKELELLREKAQESNR